jgi:WS/DGAT/MGAT family acyltransferase
MFGASAAARNPKMTPLGGLDALFLHLETPATPMHVGALSLLDAPAGSTDVFDSIRRHVEARLLLSPVFTRRLLQAPLAIANPVWIDGGDVDLEHHLKHVRLPAPGTRLQLEAAVARLHAQRLDRRRPLWQFFLIDGLADGSCAFYSKIHHAAVDGAAGVALAQVLLDTSPISPVPAAPIRRITPAEPGSARLLATLLAQNGRAGLRLLRQVPAVARGAVGLLRGGRGGVLAEWARHFDRAPATIFNRAIDARRSIATVSAPIADVRAIAEAFEVTINDVVLALVGGALRRFLEARRELPVEPLLAAMPISLRDAGDTRMNTQAWMMQANLATHVADPVERLRVIHAATDAAKSMTRQMRPALDLTLPSVGLPWLLTSAAALYGTRGIAARLPSLANVVVSNVPGPPVPLYLAGARLRSYWPLSIVEHGLGLNITVLRYVDALDFGIVAARSLVPDPAPLAHAMRATIGELQVVARTARRPATARRRPAAGDSPAAPKRQRTGGAKKSAARSTAARRPRGGRGGGN